jgi:hypothetical protein
LFSEALCLEMDETREITLFEAKEEGKTKKDGNRMGG